MNPENPLLIKTQLSSSSEDESPLRERRNSAPKLVKGNFSSHVQEIQSLRLIKTNESLGFRQKQQQIKDLKKSFSQHQQSASSLDIVKSLLNATIGPNCLLFGLTFIKAGLVLSTILAAIYCFFAYWTARLTYKHAKLSENEYLLTIERVAGKRWKTIYFLCSFLILIFIAVIFFLTLSDLSYSGLQNVFGQFSDENTLNFESFSYQYLGVIEIAILMVLMFQKKMEFILKLSSIGAYSMICQLVMIFALAIKTFTSQDVDFHSYDAPSTEHLVLFGKDSISEVLFLSSIISFFIMSFNVHNEVVPIVRNNQDQKNNNRDIRTAFISCFFIYVTAGIFGAIGVYWRPEMDGTMNTILSLNFDKSKEFELWLLALITEFCSAFQMFSVIPILIFIARSQCFEYIFGEEKEPTNFQFTLFNIFVSVIMLSCQWFNLNPSTVMVISGGVFGFILQYLVPIYLHLRCVRIHEKTQKDLGLLTKSEGIVTIPTFVADFAPGMPYRTLYILYTILIISVLYVSATMMIYIIFFGGS